ncbi:MAG: NHLP bacteriocin system secretion protein [Desulfarculus sp.]|nr:NHLP bacteriocin system secretion protein [Desulfarculus sp.]
MTEVKPGGTRPASISSPEQLDQLLRVASPGGWIALAALGLILVSALVWGFLGRIPTKVDGSGMLIRQEGVMDVVALGQGQLLEVKVNSGDLVERGQVVAIVAQPELQSQIKSTSHQLDEILDQQKRLQDFFAQQDQVKSVLYAQQAQNIKAALKDLENRMTWLQEKLESQETLREKGLITTQTLMDTRDQLAGTREKERDNRSKLKDLEEKALQDRLQKEQQLFQVQLQVLQTQGKLALLKDQMEVRSQVVSDQTGRVLELKSRAGSDVNPGTALFSLELLDKELVVAAYVPASQGKRVIKGMRIEITPSTVKRDEYGYALGEVTSVSAFPATQQGMMSLLHNQELVTQFSRAGAPITVYASFVKSAGTVSGYQWSSEKGPPQQLFSGTVCTVQVVVEEEPPIQLVIPYFKKLLGL